MRVAAHRVLLIGLDGLRPDLVDPSRMPTIGRLLERGTWFRNCVSSYPTETRVNMSTLSTGVYPGRHGVVGNAMFVPGFGENDRLQTGDGAQVLAFERGALGPLVLCPTLGDRLRVRGADLGVATSSSPGAAVLWNIRHPDHVINASDTYEDPGLAAIHAGLGPVEEEVPGTARKRAEWAVRALIAHHLPDPSKRVMTLWMSEPDKSLHRFGIGSPEVFETLQALDGCVARVIEAIDDLGMTGQVSILVLSDHGHSSTEAAGTLGTHLEQAVARRGLETPLVSVGGHIHARDGSLPLVEGRKLVSWLQEQHWCERVFAGTPELSALPGVLPLSGIYGPIRHGRAPLLAVNPRWSAAENAFGVPGVTCFLAKPPGIASSHGTLSPYEVHTFCLGYGAGFLEGVVSDLPCGLVDIAPTACHLAGFEGEEGFDGRILAEGLKHPPRGGIPRVNHAVEGLHPTPGGSARGLRVSQVHGRRYVRGTGDGNAVASGPVAPCAVRVIAHRGASAYAPENTLAAFDVALAMGAREMELDVHVTQDGEIVVIHDETVDRTTDGTGPVAEQPLRALQALDAGGWFASAFRGERIPTLGAVLDRYPGQAVFHIELKGKEPGLAHRVAEQVRGSGATKRVVFTSFRAEALEEAAAAAPEIPRGWLVRELDGVPLPVARALGLTQICPPASGLTAEAVALWKARGFDVRAWGIRTEGDMEVALQAGVDGMTVNFPDRLLARLFPDPFSVSPARAPNRR